MKLRLTIRSFAVICVAVTSTYLMVLGWRLNNTLSGPGWCATAFGAGKAAGATPIKGLDACVGLLTIQLNSSSVNSHIVLGTMALCLAVLIIIVIADARFSADTSFGKVDMQPNDPPVKVEVQQPVDKPVPVKQEDE
jgi:TRAP-type C4-dicarboxylate transport system permease small subunit